MAVVLTNHSSAEVSCPEFDKYTVKLLNEYLRERGIQFSGEKKDVLCELARSVHRLGLPVLSTPDDHASPFIDGDGLTWLTP